ncbi:MAG: hypothetical protein H6682_22230 [Candidatus Eisenbacteria bacterium]|nr:hypothetical protein [Candidatus Eisenbacteria bacterium]
MLRRTIHKWLAGFSDGQCATKEDPGGVVSVLANIYLHECSISVPGRFFLGCRRSILVRYADDAILGSLRV